MFFGFLLILCHAYVILHPYQCVEECSTKYIYTIFLSYLNKRVNIVIFYLFFCIYFCNLHGLGVFSFDIKRQLFSDFVVSNALDVLIMDSSLSPNVLSQDGPLVITNVRTIPNLVIELN